MGEVVDFYAAQWPNFTPALTISTGIYRFPLHAAARIAVETVRSTETKLRTLTFVCFDQATKDAYEEALMTRIEN